MLTLQMKGESIKHIIKTENISDVEQCSTKECNHTVHQTVKKGNVLNIFPNTEINLFPTKAKVLQLQ